MSSSMLDAIEVSYLMNSIMTGALLMNYLLYSSSWQE
jgi:hypothetical protein